MREHIKADEHFEREDVPVGRGDRALPGRGPGLQGRADRGPGRTRPAASRPSRSTATAPSPTSAAGRTARARSASRRSSSPAWRAPTGAATPSRQMLTRIYGTAFLSKEELEEHLQRLEEARARDHRKLGRELDLFMLSDLSPGLAVLAAERHPHLERADQALARPPTSSAATPRCARRSSTTSSSGSSRATGTSTATTCTSRTWRASPWA